MELFETAKQPTHLAKLAASGHRAEGMVVLAGLRAAGLRPCWFALVLLAGCGHRPLPSSATSTSNSAEPRPSVALRVLVVNEPQLAEAIGRLRGEWAERGGGPLEAVSKPWAETASIEMTDTDVVLFPARYLGELCIHNRLRPMRDSVLLGKLYNEERVFPLARQKLGVYGGRTMALPLSVQVPLFGYREPWLAASGNSPPGTWLEYLELIKRVHRAPSPFPPRDSIASWPAIMLLARAAAYACHPQQESVLFDPTTMEPRIAEAPFVRALEEWRQEMAAVSQASESSSSSKGVAEVPNDRLVWAELPGSAQVFNRSTGEWEVLAGGPRRVPLLSDGWLIAVTATSRNAVSAFELASWLASSDISSQLAPAFNAMLPCRRAQFSTISRHPTDGSSWAIDTGIAKPLEAALSRSDALIVPRIPGVDLYLAALSGAVDKALPGQPTAAEALQFAAGKWNEITDGIGRDAQRRAYLKHLGIEEP